MDGVNNLIALFGRVVGSQLSAHLHGLFNCTASGIPMSYLEQLQLYLVIDYNDGPFHQTFWI